MVYFNRILFIFEQGDGQLMKAAENELNKSIKRHLESGELFLSVWFCKSKTLRSVAYIFLGLFEKLKNKKDDLQNRWLQMQLLACFNDWMTVCLSAPLTSDLDLKPSLLSEGDSGSYGPLTASSKQYMSVLRKNYFV